jgi:hypothetical protein
VKVVDEDGTVTTTGTAIAAVAVVARVKGWRKARKKKAMRQGRREIVGGRRGVEAPNPRSAFGLNDRDVCHLLLSGRLLELTRMYVQPCSSLQKT